MSPEISQIGERDPQTYAIIGAAIAVHRELGCGFLEAVYREALAREMSARGIPYRQEVQLPVYFREERLKKSYQTDSLCYEEIIVETKAGAQLIGSDEAQIINYLKATRLERGLLLNFGAPSLQYRRFANTKQADASAG